MWLLNSRPFMLAFKTRELTRTSTLWQWQAPGTFISNTHLIVQISFWPFIGQTCVSLASDWSAVSRLVSSCPEVTSWNTDNGARLHLSLLGLHGPTSVRGWNAQTDRQIFPLIDTMTHDTTRLSLKYSNICSEMLMFDPTYSFTTFPKILGENFSIKVSWGSWYF